MIRKYWLPTIPMMPIDVVNRHAAGTGSACHAIQASDADYNGHRVGVSFKPHSVHGPCWNAEYTWGGRRVLGRGSLEMCLRAACQEYDRGARGSSVHVYVDDAAPESVEEQEQACRDVGALPCTDEVERAHAESWWTGAHEGARSAAWLKRLGCFHAVLQRALEFTGTPEDWRSQEGALLGTLMRVQA